ncbi:MAG TPA: helix-turn-helix domain-containing protein [Gammaproteobacteria bacterium]
MLVSSRTPGFPLATHVESLWYYEDLETDHAKERMLPDGGMGLVIDLGDPPKKLYDRRDLRRYTHYRRCWVSGMQRSYIVIGAEPGSSMIGARFRPGGAAALFDFPLSELSDEVVELDLIWKNVILSLREQLQEASGGEAKLDLLERFLAGRLQARPGPDRAIHAALARLRSWPVLRLRGLAAELGLSHKQLISRFAAGVGLTPKLVSRLFRFRRTLLAAHAAGDGPVDWVGLAQEHGYFDQAHLIHEFQEFAGVTPTAYVAARTRYPFYLHLE